MIMMLSWGLVMTLMGLVKSYEGLIAARLVLGMCEAGFFPAAAYTLTTWYCRFEVQSRMSVFYSASAMAGGFSGILAYGRRSIRVLGAGQVLTYRQESSTWVVLAVWQGGDGCKSRM